jgi:hypothetical protein
LRGAWGACRRALRRAASFVTRTATTAWQYTRAHLVGALVAGGAAVAVGVVAWWAGPGLSAGAGWLGGFATARFAQVRDGLRRLLLAVE